MADIIHAANFSAQAITTATDLFECTPVVDRPVYICGITLGQTTDLGDAQEEVLMVGIYRDATAGSGGSGATEYVYNNVAAGVTPTMQVVTLRGTPSTGGTLIDIIPWNIRIPLLWIPIPDMRPKFSNIAAEGPTSTFRLIAAPTDSITASGVIYWGEV